jgi:hypothetical protein
VVKDLSRGHFRANTSSIANLIVRGDDIPAADGFLPTRYSAVTRTGGVVDVYDGGNYAIASATSIENGGWNSVKSSGRIDLARDFQVFVPVTLKVGATVDRQERDNNSSTKTWNFQPNGASDVTSRQAGNFPVFPLPTSRPPGAGSWRQTRRTESRRTPTIENVAALAPLNRNNAVEAIFALWYRNQMVGRALRARPSPRPSNRPRAERTSHLRTESVS